MKTRDALVIATGFLAILLGAMPLNGYLGHLRDPGSFHQDAFIGSAWHLLAGGVPFGVGILLLAFSRASTRQISMIPLGAIPAGLFLALPALIKGKDHAWLPWLSIVAVGCVSAVLIHAIRSRWYNQPVHGTACRRP